MAMTEEEWEEFERTRGKELLRELAKGIVDSQRIPSTPARGNLRHRKKLVYMSGEGEVENEDYYTGHITGN